MDEKYVIKTVRAILTPMKNGLLVRQINGDYRELEGTNVPYKQLGYNTLEHFLKATGEFIFVERDNEVRVFAKETELTAHVTKMVREQNVSKGRKRPNGRKPQPTRYSAPRNNFRRHTNSNPYMQSTNRPVNKVVTKPVAHFPTHSRQQTWNNFARPVADLSRNLSPMQLISLAQNIDAINRRLAAPAAGMVLVPTPVQRPLSNLTNTRLRQLPMELDSNTKAKQDESNRTPVPSYTVRPQPEIQQAAEQQSQHQTVPVETIKPAERMPKITRQMFLERLANTKTERAESISKSIGSPSENRSMVSRLSAQNLLLGCIAKNMATKQADTNEKKPSFGSKQTSVLPSKAVESITRSETVPAKQAATTVLSTATTSSIKNVEQTPIHSNQKPNGILTKTTGVMARLQAKNLAPATLEPPKTSVAEDEIAVVVEKMKSTRITDLADLSYEDALSQYCHDNGFKPPEYTFCRVDKNKFLCRVSVNYQSHSTFPQSFDTENESKSEAARIAIKAIKEREMVDNLPVCTEPAAAIAEKLFDMISETGVFQSAICEKFEETYKMRLPDHWLSILKSNPYMFYISSSPLAIVTKLVKPATISFTINNRIAYKST